MMSSLGIDMEEIPDTVVKGNQSSLPHCRYMSFGKEVLEGQGLGMNSFIFKICLL